MFKDVIPASPFFTMMMIGLALLVGWGAGLLCRRIKVPMVVGYILVGVVMGGSGLSLFGEDSFSGLVFFTYLALGCIGFDIGGELALGKLRHLGKSIFWISVLEALGATILVTLAVYLYTRKLYIALVFGALASATAPAATVDVLREYQATGPLTTTVFAVVGIDDGIAIIIYAFAIFFSKMLLSKGSVKVAEVVLRPSLEIVGALAIGVFVGIVFLYLIRTYTAKRGLLVLTWGVIVFTTGLANLLHMSLILANMAQEMALVENPMLRDSGIILLMGPEHAETIAKDKWSLADIRRFLYEWGRIPLSRFTPGGSGWASIPKWIAEAPEQTDMIPVVDKPDDILVGVAGGSGKHSVFLIGGYAEAIAGPIKK